MASTNTRRSSLEDVDVIDSGRYSSQHPDTSEGGGTLPGSGVIIRRARARSIDEIQRAVVTKSYLSHHGSIRTTFHNPSFHLPTATRLMTRSGWRRDYSLYLFHKTGRFRKNVKRCVKSKAFRLFMVVIVILNAISLCLYSPAIYGDLRTRNQNIAYISTIFIFAYIVEAIMKIIAYGLIIDGKAYLRKAENVLDAILIVFGIIYVSVSGASHVISESFGAFMALKLLRILTAFKSVNFILRALAKSLAPLFYVGILTLCVMFFFTLVGMELFSGGLHGGCYANYTIPAGTLERFRVSEYPCNKEESSSTTRGSHTCPGKSNCVEWEEGPNVGITSFDNFGKGLLTVFQLISLEGWSGVFYLYESAYGYQWAWLYFTIVIFLGSIFILNLQLGVLTSVFLGVSERQEARGQIRRLKETKKYEEDIAHYRDWMQRAAELDNFSESGSIGRRPSLFFGRTWKSALHMDLVSDDELLDEEEEEEDERKRERQWTPGPEGMGEHELSLSSLPTTTTYYGYHVHRWVRKSRRIVRKALRSLVFFWFILAVLAANLILLMIIHYPADSSLDTAIYTLNYIFTGVYIAEFLLKLYGLGPRKYFSSYFNIGDFAFTVVNILDLLIFIHIDAITDHVRISVLVNACRSLKLIRVFKYTRYWKAMREIISTVFHLTTLTISLMSLIGLFLFFFTVVGIRNFGDRSSLDSYVTPNFDDLFSSFLLVFQLMTTEDWHNVLYRSLDPWVNRPNGTKQAGYWLSTYFIVAVIVGGFILVSVFLAIAVDKLSEIRSLEELHVEEHEKMAEERKARKERIHALKDTSEPLLHRRTLRRVLKFYSNNPSQRTRAGSARKHGWQYQLSLRNRSDLQLDPSSPSKFRRSASVPVGSTSSFEDSENQESRVRFRERVAPKLQNPLRLVRRTSSYFGRQARLERGGGGGGGGGSETTSAADKERRTSSLKSARTTGTAALASGPNSGRDSDVFVFTDIDTPPTYITKRHVSSPDGRSFPQASTDQPYERTQSFPGGSPGASMMEELPKLETVDEGSEAQDEESEGFQRHGEAGTSTLPLIPPSLQLAEDTPHRLRRQSSLEVLQPLQSAGLGSRQQSQLTIAESRIKERAMKMWRWIKDYFGTIHFDPKDELRSIPDHSSFFILSPDNRLRQSCYKLVRSRTFQTVTYTAVFLSSILLVLEMPITPMDTDEDDPLCLVQQTLVYAESLFIAYFLLEMLLKMVALGVFLHRGSYFRGLFNVIDFIVTMTTLVPLVVYFAALNSGKSPTDCRAYSYDTNLLPVYLAALRVIRVLRPVRAFRFTGLYVVVRGLWSSLRKIGSIFFVNVLVMVIFAVIGTEIFRGRFYYCTDPVMTTEEECNGSFFTYPSADLSCPKVEKREWMKRGLNFDNIGSALLTLFAMLTGEGWQNVMYSGINSVPREDGDPRGPEIDHNPWSSLYFLLYMCAMTFVLLNLFQGFVIVTFQEVGVKTFRETNLNRNQRNCIYYALTTRPFRRFVPKFEAHQKLNNMVSHPLFKVVIFMALVINCIVLAAQVHTNGTEAIKTIYWINFAFTLFFACEAMLKIIAFTPVNYFQSIWNSYEFIIALGSVLEVVLQLTLQDNTAEEYQYSHIASSFRVLRLLRFIPQVRLILWTLIKSLEIFPWVGVLLIVIIFSYAVVGMQLFGTIDPVPIDESEVNQITEYNNFGNFPQALLVMIRVSTGENWPDVMLSCTSDKPCFDNDTSGCGNDFAYVFFPAFYFISSILILNLFVAIIIDNFDYIVRDKSILGAHQLELLVKLWSLYDPEATGKLTTVEVMDLLRRCNPPVGWGKLCPQTLAYRKMMKLNMPLIDGKVSFHGTLFALVRVGLKIRCEGCVNCLITCNKDMMAKLKALFPNIPQETLDGVVPVDNVYTVRKEYSARLIQHIWRSYVVRRRRTIELFQGTRRRVLKAGPRRLPDAGPDLSVRALSDFELDLPPTTPFTDVTFDLPEQSSETDLGASTESTTTALVHASPRRLQTIEEIPETVSSFSDEGKLRILDATDGTPDGSGSGLELEVDAQSELSYASAQSSPVGSAEFLPTVTAFGGHRPMKETSV